MVSEGELLTLGGTFARSPVGQGTAPWGAHPRAGTCRRLSDQKVVLFVGGKMWRPENGKDLLKITQQSL